MMTRNILSVCLMVLFSALANGDTLASYFTKGSSGKENTATPVDHFTANNIIPNGGVQVGSLWRHSYNAKQGKDPKFTYTGDVGATPSDAFSISVGCAAGYQMKLETLSFDINHEAIQEGGFDSVLPAYLNLDESGSTGRGGRDMGVIYVPSIKFELYAVVDGKDLGLVSSFTTDLARYFTDSRDYSVSFDLSQLGFSKDASFSVRYSLLDNSGSTGNFDGRLNLSNVLLNGVVVPEPASALLGFMTMGFCLLRRKRH